MNDTSREEKKKTRDGSAPRSRGAPYSSWQPSQWATSAAHCSFGLRMYVRLPTSSFSRCSPALTISLRTASRARHPASNASLLAITEKPIMRVNAALA